MSDLVEIVEVGPRDGLQNESKKISTENKVQLIDRLSNCGFRRIEVASFVSPKWVPQMADSASVLQRIKRNPNISYMALENIKVALDFGVRTFDSSVGGLGGCPYAPGASGNVATERVLDTLIDLKYEVELDRDMVCQTAQFAKSLIERP